MNIGIIVNSQTGHTLEVCEMLKDRLIGQGHAATIDRVTIAGDGSPNPKTFQLEKVPDPSPYEAVVFAGWVEAFSLCRIMVRYLEGTASLSGKKVACLLTQQFPFPWMGGNRALKQMKQRCRAKGATIVGTAIVSWAKSRRDGTMAAAVEELSRNF